MLGRGVVLVGRSALGRSTTTGVAKRDDAARLTSPRLSAAVSAAAHVHALVVGVRLVAGLHTRRAADVHGALGNEVGGLALEDLADFVDDVVGLDTVARTSPAPLATLAFELGLDLLEGGTRHGDPSAREGRELGRRVVVDAGTVGAEGVVVLEVAGELGMARVLVPPSEAGDLHRREDVVLTTEQVLGAVLERALASLLLRSVFGSLQGWMRWTSRVWSGTVGDVSVRA